MVRMLEIEVSGYDPVKNLVFIKAKAPAFVSTSNLSSLKKKLSDITDTVWKSGADEISVGVTPAGVGESFGGNSSVCISVETMTAIKESLLGFYKKAVKKRFSMTEFIPLNGYGWNDLKEDVKKAIEGKRNFCILETYEDYLDLVGGEKESTSKSKKNKNRFLVKHLDVPYMSDDYCDIAILIETDKEQDLKEKYTPKLVKSEWM